MIRLSKRMSRHLRHAPQEVGLTLDQAGWVDLDDFARALRTTRERVREVVARNDKQRFAIEDGRIRASQGHTVEVELDLPVTEPPSVLYHGTVAASLPDILREGLRPMRRHDVHLSATVDTAIRVGSRRGKPIVLEVAAAAMHADGHEFRVSANGVWLTAAVPPAYLRELP
ncbi:putative RNA 2'-phosphotransferase [Saccharothrix tamanrassetensis]|uniref:Probable RNA 2'-phosphotransferase n=1 Tax=Saccharothrix tamanrassetensis TaxID=1051531 RepID=A0A841CIE3_9PSEU|nr:RNA 2'-phosphotransferase [Saccharothrix tamanrassetensis]MBB5955775.1 putative RNA 2'-phosphotransferase [Saccharothrix tamanrassetensis]